MAFLYELKWRWMYWRVRQYRRRMQHRLLFTGDPHDWARVKEENKILGFG
ncbi:hypothetical protein [Streptomyces gibsoniae]|uniref:Uncharacterized protein n=1 Tax=Streptomyces gibsoniae TaxID=3075529 RepID=A0ABU2U1T5_9ACTN|nr:hypothetical protein [Streptomyces sp. DSM 41699]MDT0467198.1 hypothetical protein [Streptomyces sp. DSM 41699]